MWYCNNLASIKMQCYDMYASWILTLFTNFCHRCVAGLFLVVHYTDDSRSSHSVSSRQTTKFYPD